MGGNFGANGTEVKTQLVAQWAQSEKISFGCLVLTINYIIEARNHFLCVDMILDNAMKSLTPAFIHQLQSTLLSASCRHKRHAPVALGYRKIPSAPKFGKTTPPAEISAAISQLFKKYESLRSIGLPEILDLHVQFERIRPFEDCNGRIGYLDGIRRWDEDRSILMDVCMEAQARFLAQIELEKLLESQARMTRKQRKEERLK